MNPILRKILINLALFLGTILVILLILEGIWRALDLRGFHQARVRDWEHALVPKEQLLPGVSIQFKPYAEFEMRYDSNPRGTFNERNAMIYHTNNYGFRGPDIHIEKSSGTKRLVLLGDSFTFGEGVKWEDAFPHHVARLVQESTSTKTEVLDMATSAWTTLDEVHYLEQMGVKFSPDLVVVVFVLNDAERAGGLDLWDNFWIRHEATQMEWSYFGSWVYNTIERELDGRRYTRALNDYALGFSQEWQTCLSELVHGKQVAESVGSRYMVCIFPFMVELNDHHPFTKIHQMVAEHCRKNGIPVLDLLEAFKGQSYQSLWVHPTDQHPNEEGHRIAAEALAAYIIGNRLM
jgi:hypothetical protein